MFATRGAMEANFRDWPEAANEDDREVIRGKIFAIISDEYRIPVRILDGPIGPATPEQVADLEAYAESVKLLRPMPTLVR